MLIRRKIITPAPEQEVVVVKPRKPAGLYAMLGTATLCAVGLIGYMTYAIFQEGQNDGEQVSAVVAPAPTEGRAAQRFSRTNEPAAKPPTTIIVNPPPVIHTPPPVVVQPKQPDTPIIVQGSSAPPETPVKKTPPPDEDPPEDVDGTVQGDGE